MKNGIGALLIQFIGLDIAVKSNRGIVKEACYSLRGLCIHDDIRKETSCAYDNSRHFVASEEVLTSLMNIASQFEELPTLAAAALLCTRSLVNAGDAIAKISARLDALKLSRTILSSTKLNATLAKAVLALTRNLCADDRRKDSLVHDGTMALILRCLSNEAFNSDAGLVEHGIACLAAMALRSPSNSAKMVSTGVVVVVVENMRRHPSHAALQRQGCLLVRNVVARSPDFREAWLDAGVEPLLRAAGSRFREVVDEAYAALRDLGCEVQMVSVDGASGQVREAFEQYGTVRKAQFNPVFEETSELQSRIVSEARAPFPRRSELDDQGGDDDDADIAVETPKAACASAENNSNCSCDSHA